MYIMIQIKMKTYTTHKSYLMIKLIKDIKILIPLHPLTYSGWLRGYYGNNGLFFKNFIFAQIFIL